MELNREKIVKALECCGQAATDCFNCPYIIKCKELYADSIALIKQLTEENERLKSVEFTCGFVKPHKVLECPIFDEIERTKADTVRKMQERLKNYYRHLSGKTLPAAVEYHIDQIAKEILEENNDDH